MTTRELITTDLHNAMRSKDATKLRVLRLLLSAIKLGDAEKGVPIEDSVILTLIQKEIKIRKDSIEDAKAAGRLELVAQNNQETDILETYLPKQLTEAELTALAKQTIAELQVSAPSEIGKVMKELLPKVQGQAPNSLISQVIRNLLESKNG